MSPERLRRRRLKSLAPKLDRELDHDRLFFRRRPDRRNRVRLAYVAEREFWGLAGTHDVPRGLQLQVVVRLGPEGALTRHFICGPRGVEPDLSEEHASFLFEAARGDTEERRTLEAAFDILGTSPAWVARAEEPSCSPRQL